MPAINVDGLTFAFPQHWEASKYDNWAYYRNQFVKQMNHIAAVDLLAVSPQDDAYLIEVKDYRHPEAVPPSELAEVVVGKVLCTLAAMLPAHLRATVPTERDLSGRVLRCGTLRVVLHIEQKPGYPPLPDLADLKQKLKAKLRAVDPHPKIVSMAKMQGLQWTVT